MVVVSKNNELTIKFGNIPWGKLLQSEVEKAMGNQGKPKGLMIYIHGGFSTSKC
jgi:hypothetical protein